MHALIKSYCFLVLGDRLNKVNENVSQITIVAEVFHIFTCSICNPILLYPKRDFAIIECMQYAPLICEYTIHIAGIVTHWWHTLEFQAWYALSWLNHIVPWHPCWGNRLGWTKFKWGCFTDNHCGRSFPHFHIHSICNPYYFMSKGFAIIECMQYAPLICEYTIIHTTGIVTHWRHTIEFLASYATMHAISWLTHFVLWHPCWGDR